MQLLYSGYYDFDHTTIPFQVDSNFYYVTKMDIPNVVLLLDNNKKPTIFYSYQDKTWFDNTTFTNQIRKKYKVNRVYCTSQLQDYLSSLPHSKIEIIGDIKPLKLRWPKG